MNSRMEWTSAIRIPYKKINGCSWLFFFRICLKRSLAAERTSLCAGTWPSSQAKVTSKKSPDCRSWKGKPKNYDGTAAKHTWVNSLLKTLLKSFQVRQNFCISASPICASERMQWVGQVMHEYCLTLICCRFHNIVLVWWLMGGFFNTFHFNPTLFDKNTSSNPKSYWAGASTRRVWVSSLTRTARWEARTTSSS